MFCRQCGKIIPAESVYCPECGTQTKNAHSLQYSPIKQHQSVQNREPIYQTVAYQQKPIRSKRSMQKTFTAKSHLLRDVILAIIITFVVLFIIIKAANSPSVDNGENSKSRKIVQAPPLEKETQTDFETGVTPELEDQTEEVKDLDQEPEPKLEPVRVKIGESAALGDLEVTVTGYSFSQYAGNLGTLGKAQSGLSYCVVYVDVKNTGTSTLELTGLFDSHNYVFTLIYDEENTYNETWFDYSDFLAANDSIPSKGTLHGKLLNFTVPAEMQNDGLSLSIQLSYNSIWRDEKIIWTLR